MGWKEYTAELSSLLDLVDIHKVQNLVDAIEDVYRQDRCIFIIGNGGSAANASHLCEDLGKGTLADLQDQPRLRIASLTDNVSYILAWANDEGYERIFVEQLKNLARPGDLLLAISGSGNSANILRAVEWARANSVHTFGICGFDGGELVHLAHQSLRVPSHNMGIVETIHSAVFHWLMDKLHSRFSEMAGINV